MGTDSTQIFGVLLYTVFMVINEKLGEERKLTYDQLEQGLLTIGSNDDQWYSKRYDYYKTIDFIKEFRIGEFYEILAGLHGCLIKKNLNNTNIKVVAISEEKLPKYLDEAYEYEINDGCQMGVIASSILLNIISSKRDNNNGLLEPQILYIQRLFKPLFS